LSQEIRGVIDIPSAPQWEALNKAFQLNQGIIRITIHARVRVCANPNCGMTERDTTIKFIRGRSDWNALIRNTWICNSCYQYARRSYGELRVPKELPAKVQASLREKVST